MGGGRIHKCRWGAGFTSVGGGGGAGFTSIGGGAGFTSVGGGGAGFTSVGGGGQDSQV